MSQDRADKNRRRGKRKQKTTARRHVRPVRGHDGADDAEDQALTQGLREALNHPHPLGLLSLVSTLMTVTDPREQNPFGRLADDEALSLEMLVESFTGVDLPETTAAATVIAALTPDDILRTRTHRGIAGRRHRLPGWLDRLGDARVVRVVRHSHVLGDGDNYLLDVRLGDAFAWTVVLYVDHNLGTVVKDGFAVEGSVEEVLTTMIEPLVDDDQGLTDVEPAFARAVVQDAVASGAVTFPPLESDTWPATRPLVEWLLRTMPAGGRAADRPEWSEKDRRELVDDFFSSPYAMLDDADARDLLDTVLWFGTDYGPGDPLRWSPVNVEILLADWLPRKVVADVEYLAKVPDVLQAFVRYCHNRRGIRAELTTQVLAAVDQWEADYQRTIRTNRPGRAQELAAVIAGASGADADWSIDEMMLDGLDRAVGGRAALMDLSVAPLPDEPFEWSGIPDDIRGSVAEVLALCDGCCKEMLDPEHRTASRRLLRRAAVGDPGIFRRKASSRTAAAAVCWIIAKANHTVSQRRATLTAKELLAWFGVTGAQRAGVFLRAVGAADDTYEVRLGAADLLIASRRQQIVGQRDHYVSEIDWSVEPRT